MLTTLCQLAYQFEDSSIGFSANHSSVIKTGQLVSYIGAANDVSFENRQKIGNFVPPNAIGVAAYDKAAGDTTLSVIVGKIWPIRIEQATTTAALTAILNDTYTVSVNEAGEVVATGGATLAGAGGQTYSTLFTGASSIVNELGPDPVRYLLCTPYLS